VYEEIGKVTRNKIPWYPTINYEKCNRCGTCVEFCSLGVYEFEECQGEKRPAVKNPYNCVVLCTGCQEESPADAIMHPSKEKTQKLIEKLLKTKT
jgi:NAD-dependent dihydropyrimidine dehydrogenase PreA subunit